MIYEYRKCSEICVSVDYSDEISVKRPNQAISRMYEIVKKAATQGSEVITKLSDKTRLYQGCSFFSEA